MTADTTLRGRIETAARTVPIRLGPNALAMAQRGGWRFTRDGRDLCPDHANERTDRP